MSISNFNCYYKNYKKYLKNTIKKNIKYRPLIKNLLKNTSGRNNKGFITAYHRGGGVKRLYKKICFNYINLLKLNIKNWIVERIEYDNNRNTNIALLTTKQLKYKYKLKKKFLKRKWFLYNFFNTYYIYRLANENLKKGDFVNFYAKNKQYFPLENQFVKLYDIPTGSYIFNIEFLPNTKGKLIRSAGSKAKLLRKYDKYGVISLPSGEKKLLLLSCFATLGIPSNSLYKFKKNYKAGNSRWKNIRPKVRGVAKNPIDHPHGGGEGKSSGGRHSVSKWGMLTKGYVTKRKKVKKKKRYV